MGVCVEEEEGEGGRHLLGGRTTPARSSSRFIYRALSRLLLSSIFSRWDRLYCLFGTCVSEPQSAFSCREGARDRATAFSFNYCSAAVLSAALGAGLESELAPAAALSVGAGALSCALLLSPDDGLDGAAAGPAGTLSSSLAASMPAAAGAGAAEADGLAVAGASEVAAAAAAVDGDAGFCCCCDDSSSLVSPSSIDSSSLSPPPVVAVGAGSPGLLVLVPVLPGPLAVLEAVGSDGFGAAAELEWGPMEFEGVDDLLSLSMAMPESALAAVTGDLASAPAAFAGIDDGAPPAGPVTAAAAAEDDDEEEEDCAAGVACDDC